MTDWHSTWMKYAGAAMILADQDLKKACYQAYIDGDHAELGRLMSLLFSRYATGANANLVKHERA